MSFSDGLRNFIQRTQGAARKSFDRVENTTDAVTARAQESADRARNIAQSETTEAVSSFKQGLQGYLQKKQESIQPTIKTFQRGYNETNQGIGRFNPRTMPKIVGKTVANFASPVSLTSAAFTPERFKTGINALGTNPKNYTPEQESLAAEQAIGMFPSAGVVNKSAKGVSKAAKKTDDLFKNLSPDVKNYVATQTAREEAARKGERLGFVERLKQAKNTAKRKFVNKESYIEDVIKKEAGKQNKDVSGSVFDFTTAKYRKQGLNTIVNKEIKDSGFEGLINDVPDYDLFSKYIAAKQKIHRIEQGKEVGQSSGNVDIALEAQLVSELAPVMESFSQKLKNINYKLLDDEVKYGFRSADNAAMLKKENPYYVPLNRIYSDIEEEVLGKGAQFAKGGASPRSLLKKMEGSEREIVDPIKSIYERFVRVHNAGLNNKTREAIVNTFDNLKNPFKLTPQRTAKDVIERQKLYSQIAKNNENIQPLLEETAGISKELRLKNTSITALKNELSKLSDHAQTLASEMESRSTIKPLVDKIFTRQNKIQNILSKKQILETDKKYLEESIAFLREGNKKLFNEAKELRDIKKAPADNTFSFWRNGIEERWQSEDPELIRALLSSGQEQIDGAGKILLGAQRAFKLGTTGLNIAFALPNLAVDQTMGFINGKYGRTMFNPVVNFHALMAAIGKGKYADEIKRSGAITTSFDVTRQKTAQTLEKVRSKKNIGTRAAYAIHHPIKTFDDFITTFEDIVGTTERFTRAQQYIGAKKAATKTGKGVGFANAEALKAAKMNTANFQDQGEFGSVMRMWTPYFAAGIQGVRSTAGALKDRPITTGAKIGLTVITPVMAATYWNLSDEKRAKAYKDLNPKEKENNVIIFPPGDPVQNEDGSWNVIKFKLPPNLAKLASLSQAIIEGQYDATEKPEFTDIAKAVIGLYSPTGTDKGDVVGLLAGPAKPELEQFVNKNLYFDTPLISEGLEQLPAEKQVKENTPKTLSLAAEFIKSKTGVGLSPARADAYLKARFGTFTPQILNATDRFLVGLNIIGQEEVGGKSTLDAVFSRFAEARGGEKGQKNYEFVDNLDKKQDAKTNELNKQAEILYQDLKAMPKEERKKKYLEIEELDPEMVERINDAAKNDELQLEPWEKALRSLNVQNGARTYAIFNITKDMSKDERYIFAERMQEAGILSEEVNQQLSELYSNQDTILPKLKEKFSQ